MFDFLLLVTFTIYEGEIMNSIIMSGAKRPKNFLASRKKTRGQSWP